MIVNFYVHDANGLILRTGLCPTNCLLQQARHGEVVRQGKANDAAQYFDVANMVLKDRPTLPAVLNGNVLSGLPTPSTLTIENTQYEVSDGIATLFFAFAGTYLIKAAAWPYLDGKFEVTV